MKEELFTSSVPRALEMKSKLFGLELADLLLIFMNLSVTNLVFGGTKLRYLMVWGTTLGMASVLYFVKRGKPDLYIKHLAQFWIRPSYFAAGAKDTKAKRFFIGESDAKK